MFLNREVLGSVLSVRKISDKSATKHDRMFNTQDEERRGAAGR